MSSSVSKPVFKSVPTRWRPILAVVVVLGAAAATWPRWSPVAKTWLASYTGQDAKEPANAEPADAHAGHDHGGADLDSLDLSEQARNNIGMKFAKVVLASFDRTISIPAMVAERPGRSSLNVTAPITGVVTKIYAILGEAVAPGQKLFELRMTDEELVRAQSEFLRTVEELDVIALEVKRLEQVTVNGAIAGKTLLERKYEQQRQEAVLRAQKQSLSLHGLKSDQIQSILSQRKLLDSIVVSVPIDEEQANGARELPAYQLQRLEVERGQRVADGDTLAMLGDHAQLYIEGNAFERDLAEVSRALEANRRVTAVLELPGGKQELVRDLHIVYVAGEIDPQSRTFHFYVKLPNALLRDETGEDGHRFITWRFRPGQRMQLLVPVETLADSIVLPIDAVAQDGIETYVFLPNGKKLVRRPVHVEYRDALWAVIANDGSIFPGDTVAMNGAAQLLLAIKNKSGGAPDPHAGHNH